MNRGPNYVPFELSNSEEIALAIDLSLDNFSIFNGELVYDNIENVFSGKLVRWATNPVKYYLRAIKGSRLEKTIRSHY
jgi:hypothetical protein